MEIYKKNDALVIKMAQKKGFKQRLLLLSDIHFDSTKCDRARLKRHLEQAKQNNAKILMFGDIFDVMGGKWDKRSGKGDVRPEYNRKTYFQDITKDAAKFFMPYKENIVLVSDGNHELSIRDRHEFDLLDEFVDRLNGYQDGTVQRGKYAGFIKFQFEKESKGERSSQIMYYTHGNGGNSPVTKGVIKSNRRQDEIFADIYVSGHTHTKYDIPRTQARLNEQCSVKVVEPAHINLGCYKNDYLSGDWATIKGFAAPALGGVWMEFRYRNKQILRSNWWCD